MDICATKPLRKREVTASDVVSSFFYLPLLFESPNPYRLNQTGVRATASMVVTEKEVRVLRRDKPTLVIKTVAFFKKTEKYTSNLEKLLSYIPH